MTAIASMMNDTSVIQKVYGAKNFHQRLSGTPAMAHIVTLVVGQKRLEKPSPNWKARTAIWRLISSRSASPRAEP